jgi:hypothetical protein
MPSPITAEEPPSSIGSQLPTESIRQKTGGDICQLGAEKLELLADKLFKVTLSHEMKNAQK